MRGEGRRVDDAVGARAQRLEQAPFGLDAVDQRAVGRHGMAAARFGETARQRLVVAVEVEQSHVEALFAEQPVDRGDQRVDAEIARARIDADGDGPRMRRVSVGKHEAREQREREIVDRLVAGILKGAHRGRTAGAGKAGHQRDASTRRKGGLRVRDGQGDDHGMVFARSRSVREQLALTGKTDRDANFCGSRGGKGVEGKQRQLHAEQLARRRFGQTLDGRSPGELDDQTQLRAVGAGHFDVVQMHDSDASYFQLSGKPAGCAGPDAVTAAFEVDPVVGHKPRPVIDQPQCKIRFATARRSAQ